MKLPLCWFDIAVLVALLLFVLRNAWIGFLRGLSSLLGLVAGYLLAGRLAARVADVLSPWVGGAWLPVLSYGVSFLLGFLAVFIVVELLVRALRRLRLGWLDHLLGAGLGFVKGVVLATLVFVLLVSFYPRSREMFRHSLTYPYLVRASRFLVQIFPPRWKSRFNYNLRHWLGVGHGQEV